MAPLSSVHTANTSFYSSRPLVAVLIGATSGIGQHAAQALAHQYSNQQTFLHLYIVGRSQSSADTVLSQCTQACPHAQLTFIRAADLTLLRDMDRVCDEIIRLENQKSASGSGTPRIDLLILTSGMLNFGARQETLEELDKWMALLYYARIRCIMRLMPLLLASPAPHVVSVHAAGLEGKLISDDLSLRDPNNYSLLQVRSHLTHFVTMAFERLARENPRLGLVNVFPGMVITPAYADSAFPVWFKVIWALVGPFLRLFYAMPHEEAGARMIFLGTTRFESRKDYESDSFVRAVKGTSGLTGTGAYAIGQDGEPVASRADYADLRRRGFEDTVWEHTMKACAEIEAHGSFHG